MLLGDEGTAMTDVATDGVAEVDRRRVLLGMSAVGVAGVLAACGGSNEPETVVEAPTPVEDEPDSTPETVEPDDENENGGGTDDGDEDDSEVDGALIATAEVPVGAGVILAAEEVVITQPAEGEFRAFSIACTHQGCPVNSVEDGLIRCICHGSRFHIDDGSVENGPATRPLGEVAIAVEGDQIVRA
jgi:Rieske Fe-S protein